LIREETVIILGAGAGPHFGYPLGNDLWKGYMSRGANKYRIPEHLSRLGISQDDFGHWLDRATAAHVRRDRKRTKAKIRPVVYRLAIFKAASEGGNRDYYTGESLNWQLLRHFSKNNGLGRDE
jgi:hypothetical protein